MDDDNPAWRTPTVVQICQSIRQTGDYAAGLAILADALEEAGYDGKYGLPAMRAAGVPLLEAERIVAYVYSTETADAAKWLDEFGRRVGYSYKTVVEAGRRFVETGEPYRDEVGNNWDASNAMFHTEEQLKFWKAFALVTCAEVPKVDATVEWNDNTNPFTCPC